MKPLWIYGDYDDHNEDNGNDYDNGDDDDDTCIRTAQWDNDDEWRGWYAVDDEDDYDEGNDSGYDDGDDIKAAHWEVSCKPKYKV